MKSTIWKKIRKGIGVLAASMCFMSAVFCVYAEGEKIVSTKTDGENIYLYVKGVSGITGGEVQIGNHICDKEDVFVGDLNGHAVPMKTVILVDNSLSIPKENREDVQTIFNSVLDGHMQGEQFWIGTISDSVTWLNEGFSSDYDMLKTCIEGMTYNNQDTYFSDCLYSVVTELAKEKDGTYTRIIVLSDGADDRVIGYTNAEVTALLEKSKIPVYTIGTIGNNTALENMFAFSRASGAEYYLLDNTISNEDIVASLAVDQIMVCIKIVPDAALMDGSEKNIQLTLVTENGEIVLSTAVVMPFGNGAYTETIPEPTAVPQEEEENSVPSMNQNNELPSFGSTQNDEKEESKEKGTNVFLIIGISAAVCACIGTVIAVIIIKKNKNRTSTNKAQGITASEQMSMSSFDAVDEEENMTINPNSESEEKDETLMFGGSSGATMALWGNTPASTKQQTHLVLKDMERPNVMFKVPIVDTVRVGRKDADIVIDYDKYVSSKHCEIRKRGEILSIRDLGSANGTFYENRRIYDQETTIVNGSVIKIGQTKLKITITKE